MKINGFTAQFETLEGNAPLRCILANKMKLEKVLSGEEAVDFIAPLIAPGGGGGESLATA